MLYSPWNSDFLTMEKTEIKGWRVGSGKANFPLIPVSVCGACYRAGWESGENWSFFGVLFHFYDFWGFGRGFAFRGDLRHQEDQLERIKGTLLGSGE